MLVSKLSEIVMRKILLNQQIELHRVKKKKKKVGNNSSFIQPVFIMHPPSAKPLGKCQYGLNTAAACWGLAR